MKDNNLLRQLTSEEMTACDIEVAKEWISDLYERLIPE